jgi:AbrB family transcriptional regulator (stage V sporulation protein T)
MKATGIVRRIDDLGRVVIPKEIRRTLRIRDGDPLEIFTEKDGEVIFKKYSPMGELSEFADQICESLGRNTGRIAAVADRDSIIALSGAPKGALMDKQNSRELEQLMEQRRPYRYTGGSRIQAAESVENYYLGVAAPILSQGDLMGCVMVLMDDQSAPVGDAEQKVCQTVASFLGKQMES